jgi:hypothetical protein
MDMNIPETDRSLREPAQTGTPVIVVATPPVDARQQSPAPPAAPKDIWDDDWDPFEAIPPINWRSPILIRTVSALLAMLLLGAASGFVYLRFISPPAPHLWVENFPTPYLGELWWKLAGTDRNGLRWTPNGYRISPKPGQSAFITFDTTEVVIPLPTWRTQVRDAIGSVPPPSADRLILDLMTERRGGYLTVLERPPVHVQVSKFGLMITLPSATDPKQLQNVILPDPSKPDGSTWQFDRTGTELALRIDGREIWKGSVPTIDKTIRLGETRTDPEHDGTVTFRSVKYGGAP